MKFFNKENWADIKDNMSDVCDTCVDFCAKRPDMHEESLIQINFKSGIVERIWFREFHSIRNEAGKITNLTWKLGKGMHSMPAIDVNSIENVFVVRIANKLGE